MCASRLKGTLDRNMSDCQTTFMLGRQFLDGVMILNEIIDLAKKEIQKYMMLKVDCEQACDCVSWSYLKFMLKKFGFGVRWKKWMETCIF